MDELRHTFLQRCALYLDNRLYGLKWTIRDIVYYLRHRQFKEAALRPFWREEDQGDEP